MSNLTNYFLLPLVVEGGRKAFGESNYINGYLSDCNKLLVSVRNREEVSGRVYQSPGYLGEFETTIGITFLTFDFPPYFKEDVLKFRQGKYSRMSDTAKSRIRMYSGLVYRKFNADLGDYVTHKKLLALDRSPLLKKELELNLDVRLPADAELLSLPNEEEFLRLKLDEDDITSENQSEPSGVDPGLQN